MLLEKVNNLELCSILCGCHDTIKDFILFSNNYFRGILAVQVSKLDDYEDIVSEAVQQFAPVKDRTRERP
jgi:hypothetical protein